jgi:broad specificity phosphatase PhoE
MNRRDLLRWSAGLSLAKLSSSPLSVSAQSDAAYLQALKRGGALVLIRHAVTVPGIGDPPHMRLDDCTTQRDLSEEGILQSRRFGQWFRRHGLTPSAVKSSQWCRCLRTANEAFSETNFGRALPVQPWVALNSFFQGHGHRDRQLQEAAGAAKKFALEAKPGEFQVWVTHQVVISSLTNQWLGMGEMLVARHPPTGTTLQVLASGISF